MSEMLDAIAIGVSVVAVGISIWSARKSNRTADRLVAIEEGRDKEQRVAQRKARLRVTMSRTSRASGGTVGRLTIHNDGPAPAGDVTLHASGDGQLAAVRAILEDVKPVERLAAGQTVAFPVFTFDGMPSYYRLSLTWRNADGTPGEWESVVSLVYV